MDHPFDLRMVPGTSWTRDADGRITVRAGPASVALGEVRSATEARGARAVPAEYVASLGGAPALALRPMTAPFELAYRALDPATPLRASRFATVRRDGDLMMLESPLSHARVRCLDPRAIALWAALAQPRSPAALADALGVPVADGTRCLELLACAALVDVVDAAGNLPEDSDPALRMWSHHDALFHARSRLGRHDDPFGATFPFRDTQPCPPARRAPYPGPRIPLPKADLDGLRELDPPLTRVLEERRSKRQLDGPPLALERLGAFLYRVARVTASHPPCADRAYEATWHTYPTGGGMGDLEVYVIAARCAGLERGAYHYDAHAHELARLEPSTPDAVDRLLAGARRVTALTVDPHVVLVFGARVTRGLWKYSAMYYALTLKNVGALMQTCYLVATAMDLSPCSLGAGDADLFAELTGCRYFEECSVGEFMLGTSESS